MGPLSISCPNLQTENQRSAGLAWHVAGQAHQYFHQLGTNSALQLLAARARLAFIKANTRATDTKGSLT